MKASQPQLFGYLLIVISLVIFWQIYHQIQEFQSLAKQETHIFTYLLQNRSVNCWYKHQVYFFKFTGCEQAQLNQKYLLTGTSMEITDTMFSQQIVLTVQSIALIPQKGTWGSIWLNRIFHGFDQINQSLVNWIRRSLPFTQGELMLGLVLGSTPSFLESFRHKIKVTGTQHVLVASGFNISLVAMLMSKVLSPLLSSSKLKSILVTLVIVIYCLILGISAPLSRAVIMSLLSIWARLLTYRQFRPLYGLLLAASAMIILHPPYLFDISFQLSMLATLSIVWFMPILSSRQTLSGLMVNDLSQVSNFGSNRVVVVDWILELLRESLFVTVSAQLLVWPLLMHHFGELSLLSVVANTMLTWMTPMLTSAGFIFLVVMTSLSWSAVLSGLMVTIFGLILWWPITLYLSGIEWLGSYSAALMSTPHLSDVGVIAWWTVLLIWSVWWKKSKQAQPLLL